MPTYPNFLKANVGNLMPVVREDFVAPIAAAVANVLAAYKPGADGNGGVAVSKNTWLIQPDYPRKLQVVCANAGAGFTGSLVVTGKDILDNTISETLTIDSAADLIYTTVKAYATLSTIIGRVYDTAANDTISVGLTKEFQLLYRAEAIKRELSGGVPQAIATTLDTTANTYAPTVTPNAALSFQLWYTRKI